MDNFHQVPIIQKIYNFYKELYLAIEKMPKKNKYSLGEKLSKATFDLLELLIAASFHQKETKIAYLDRANVKLDLLKILIRLAEDIKALPTKKYLYLEELLQEIGKMLGGWIRSIR